MTLSRVLSFAVVAAAALLGAVPACAHPLGNFTINHLVKVDVRGSVMRARYVLDMAEIPTFQVMRARSAGGRMDRAQLQAWANDEAGVIASALDIRRVIVPQSEIELVRDDTRGVDLRFASHPMRVLHVDQVTREVIQRVAGRCDVDEAEQRRLELLI